MVQRLSVALDEFTRAHVVGQVLTSPADISWGPEILVQPDVFVLPLEEVRTLDWSRVRTLLLAIEVLSPSTARADRFTKRRLFQEVRVPLYWIVDPDARLAEVWTPAAAFPAVERDTLVWHPAGAPSPFTLALEELFRPA
jgi:Uma2 family endonuclease